MKVIIISTTIFPLPPPGYSGLEMLCYNWAVQMHNLGVQVAVIAPEGSQLPEGIELIPVALREGEDSAYAKYRQTLLDRLNDGWVCMDNSWSWMSVLSQMEADRQLPIIHCYHSDPYNLQSPPPIRYPCLVAFSEAQANIMRSRWQTAVRVQYHGIDLDFYKPDQSVNRGDRYLFLARYCPEKGFLEVSYLAKKCKVGLDAFGDTEIIGPNEAYMRKCFEEADGRQIRVNPGIPREQTVKEYQSHKALITYPNYVEIFGLATMECLATGTPVISKDSGAARELIINGKTGFVVSTLDEFEDLINSDAVSKIKPEDCRKRAEKFSIQASAKKHLKIMEDLKNGLYW